MSAPGERLATVAAYEAAAATCLPAMALDYFRSGADDEVTLARNVEALRRCELWPRVLVDVSRVDASTTLLGAPLATPIAVAPTAYHRLAHPDGELASARGAAAAGALYVAATLATVPLEEIAAASSAPKWFQLYVHRDRGVTHELVERARRAGYAALVVTLDTPLLGRRLADERNRFALPPGMRMANLPEAPVDATDGSALAAWFAARHDASFTWSDLAALAARAGLPLVAKGILRADDARRAVDAGARAVWVSNHGGRQLDGAPATLDALARVVDAAGARAEVYVDGGVRSGTDALKALALGARAVFVGRPVLYGLAVAGADGVRDVLALLHGELLRAMALTGAPTLAAVDATLVRLPDRR